MVASGTIHEASTSATIRVESVRHREKRGGGGVVGWGGGGGDLSAIGLQSIFVDSLEDGPPRRTGHWVATVGVEVDALCQGGGNLRSGHHCRQGQAIADALSETTGVEDQQKKNSCHHAQSTFQGSIQ